METTQDQTTEESQDREEIEKQALKRQALMHKLSELYDKKLDDEMGKLHNQFAGFISASNLPIPQVLLVLEMLKKETIEQAYKKYIGD